MAKRILELVEGGNVFESSGFSLIKVTKNSTEEYLELPIKSTGVADFQEELRGAAPKPPVRKELIKKDSKEGREMGLLRDRLTQVFDTTDEEYINAMETHSQDFVWRVIVFALDLSWKKRDGSEVVDFEDKKSILKSSGLTGTHADQIFSDVQNLTKIEAEEEDFLSEN